MPIRTRRLVLLGILFGLFLSAIEISVVGTAAPQIVSAIGGLDSYSWMFAAYLLSSTFAMPLWGRISDQLGRKKLFIAAMSIFLFGSVLCGLAQSMNQLILFRAVKGLGGGGIMPLALTIISDIYPYKERAKMQGYLSSVWGISSIIGPFIGGGLTDAFGWRSVFFVNLVPGSIAIFLLSRYFHENHSRATKLQLSLRSLGLCALFMFSILGGLKLIQKNQWELGLVLMAVSLVFLLIFLKWEKRIEFPLLSPALLQNRVFVVSCLTGFFSSMLVIGLASFCPLLFQSVMGFTPTESGLMLVPFTIAWLSGSILSTRILLRRDYRQLMLFGNFLTALGSVIFMFFFFQQNILSISVITALMGLGMAFNYPIALIVTQHSVPKNEVGFATSGLTWIRNMGTTIGTTVMGVVLSLVFQSQILKALPNASPELVQTLKNKPEIFFQAGASSLLPGHIDVRGILFHGLYWVFFIQCLAVLIAFAMTFWLPKTKPEIRSPS